MEKQKSKSNNPKGHNQYTNEGKGSSTKQSAQPRDAEGRFEKKDSSSKKSSTSKSSSKSKTH